MKEQIEINSILKKIVMGITAFI